MVELAGSKVAVALVCVVVVVVPAAVVAAVGEIRILVPRRAQLSPLGVV